DYLRRVWGNIGAAVIGRRLFDLTDGWGGRPAIGDAVFVVTHEAPADWRYPDAPFTFVTDGLHAATAQAKAFAGARAVARPAGSLTGQAIAAGLVDEVSVGLVPVIFGSGVRFFGDYAASPVLLDNPQVVQGDRVTHLHYRVHKRSEEHTSELQSLTNLVCRLLLEKKKTQQMQQTVRR